MRYKLFIFLIAPAQAWQWAWAKLLGCYYSSTEMPPDINMGKLHNALLMYKAEEIGFGKMRECCAAWKQDREFFLPETSEGSS